MGKKNRFKRTSAKRVGEIMEEMDTPHGDFDLTEQFMSRGAGSPAGPKASQPLLAAFRNTYEAVGSEHLAQEIFTVGRLRQYFQAWIIPKMPDPLPVYIEELDYMGFPMRTSFDGSACIMVRYRGAVEVSAEEVEISDFPSQELQPAEAMPAQVMAYTDDWQDDMSDIPYPFCVDEG